MKALIIAIMLSLVTSTSYAATAYWTGRSEQVQTVTYQWGWNCQYNYAGQYFWRVFSGFCPMSVEVY